MSNKFAKPKEKTWTNDPELQNPETGETTAKGKAKLKDIKEKNAGKESSKAVKAPAKKEASKPAKASAKKAPAKKEAANSEPDKRKIKVLAKENPKREGSKAHATFALYKSSKTVQDFLDAGGSTADLRYDEKAGHIELA